MTFCSHLRKEQKRLRPQSFTGFEGSDAWDVNSPMEREADARQFGTGASGGSTPIQPNTYSSEVLNLLVMKVLNQPILLNLPPNKSRWDPGKPAAPGHRTRVDHFFLKYGSTIDFDCSPGEDHGCQQQQQRHGHHPAALPEVLQGRQLRRQLQGHRDELS